jgi:hypothetical protein
MFRSAFALALLAVAALMFGRGTALAMSPPCGWFTQAEISEALAKR